MTLLLKVLNQKGEPARKRCSECGSLMFYFTDCAGNRHWGCMACANRELGQPDGPCEDCS